ncbi:helix-turn-helix transcriptional regulator [Streptomyces sp. NPDC002012]|uniref:helix-turn-helix domain-containing protein n=1 Tax=unclassified Streptomyces TaxID=2593676 RepID=UPI00331CF237
MGRRENAVAAATRQSEALALWLRAQRDRQGLNYAAMARVIEYEFTASMLSRAASGRTVPSRKAVEAYARACNADLGEARRLWKAARSAEQSRRGRELTPDGFQDLAAKLGRALAHPEVIEDYGQLRRAMVQLRAREGQPSLGELQERAGRMPDGVHHRLPKSSLSAILRGESVPLRRHVTAFAEAMGASRRKVAEWERAWDRVSGRDEPQAVMPARPALVDPQPAHGPPTVTTTPAPPLIRISLREVRKSDDSDTKVLVGPTIAPPGVDLRAEDVKFLSMHAFTPTNSGRRQGWSGPMRAHPPVGYTRNGLPIRSPRLYDHAQAPVLRVGAARQVNALGTRGVPAELPPLRFLIDLK